MKNMSDEKQKERGILFKGEMVLALLAGRKTQTRRMVKYFDGTTFAKDPNRIVRVKTRDGNCEAFSFYASGGSSCLPEHFEVSKYGPIGRRLWVKETWRPVGPWECREDGATIQYKSDESYERKLGWPTDFRIKTSDERGKWRPSIFMPRWASRITLEVTNIRVERLQDISEEDAKAEGVIPKGRRTTHCYRDGEAIPHRLAYQDLWNEINGAGSWNKNPWVFVYEFRRAQ